MNVRIFLLFQKENAEGVIHKLLSLRQRVGASLLLLRSEQWIGGGGCQKIAIFERTYFMDDPYAFLVIPKALLPLTHGTREYHITQSYFALT